MSECQENDLFSLNSHILTIKSTRKRYIISVITSEWVENLKDITGSYFDICFVFDLLYWLVFNYISSDFFQFQVKTHCCIIMIYNTTTRS